MRIGIFDFALIWKEARRCFGEGKCRAFVYLIFSYALFGPAALFTLVLVLGLAGAFLNLLMTLLFYGLSGLDQPIEREFLVPAVLCLRAFMFVVPFGSLPVKILLVIPCSVAGGFLWLRAQKHNSEFNPVATISSSTQRLLPARPQAGRWAKVFQPDNDDRVIYSEKFLRQKVNYIHTNPVTKGLVTVAADYPWSSCKSYLTGNPSPVGLDPWS